MRKRALLVARLLTGGTFLYASLGKIADPAGFAKAIDNYRLVPDAGLGLLAVVLPWVEALAGLLLILGVLSAGSALIVSVLSAVFAGAIASALVRGLDVSCGCFTLQAGQTAAGWGHVGLDLLLAALAVAVLVWGPGSLALERQEG